jgi:hypothetical protein
MSTSAALRLAVCLLLLASIGPTATAPADDKKADAKVQEVAGNAEFLRSVPKHFATLKAIDRARNRVTVLLDGETAAKEWPLIPDAEVKLAGWWGRLDQLKIGDRVWVWFQLDRVQQPVAISMLCDELSEQDIHGPGVTLERIGPASSGDKLTELSMKPVKGTSRTIKVSKVECWIGKERVTPDQFVGKKAYVQTKGDGARLILDADAFEARRQQQKNTLHKRWLDEGLPGTVTFLHIFGGEMDLMLDHEAMRWGRSLKYGDKVTLSASPPIEGVVKSVKPWRERTQLRLVVRGYDQTDLALGQRVFLRMPAPAAEVDTASLPPDLDRPRTKQERVEWFLASIYCTCKVGGDGCTGHFYTLASCNVNACGMPNHVRRFVAEKIDKGLTDKQIYEELLKEQGPGLIKPHLLP